jgi:hypothetical protein
MRSAYWQYEGPATDCLAKSKYKLVCSKRMHRRRKKQHVIIESEDANPLVAKFVLIFRPLRPFSIPLQPAPRLLSSARLSFALDFCAWRSAGRSSPARGESSHASWKFLTGSHQS